MEDKRKIAAKSGQLRYYTERKYEESPILKSMDPYRQDLPIGYAKNCTRRIDVRESTKDCRDDLGFGIIHARYLDMPAVMDGVDHYNAFALLDLMANVYDENDAKAPQNSTVLDALAYLETRPGYTVEMLRRFYPSNANWMDSQSGEGPNNNRILDPVQHSVMMKHLQERPEVRQSILCGSRHHQYYKDYEKDTTSQGYEPAFDE